MQILLDTHALIWYLEGDAQLSNTAKAMIENPINSIYVSHVSFYEMAIKMAIGKMETNKTLKDFFEGTKNSYIEILGIEEEHLIEYLNIPLEPDHKDPFDRLLIAVALFAEFSIISADNKFQYYKHLVDIIW